jgi:hypothetical protein
MSPAPVRFTLEDADRAHEAWGCNCGPAAVAAIAGLTLDELRPHLGDFEQKRYTNPTLLWQILRNAGIRYQCTLNQMSSEHQGMLAWPQYGLARVQWEGPWTAPGVPIKARYRHTHWVGAISHASDWTTPGWEEPRIFDINCMCVGGWVPESEWTTSVVPWLLKECVPRANGRWHLTHVVEVERRLRESTEPSRSTAALSDTSTTTETGTQTISLPDKESF